MSSEYSSHGPALSKLNSIFVTSSETSFGYIGIKPILCDNMSSGIGVLFLVISTRETASVGTSRSMVRRIPFTIALLARLIVREALDSSNVVFVINMLFVSQCILSSHKTDMTLVR